MNELVYPRLQKELEKRNLSVRALIMRTDLNYPALCPKLTHRGGITLDEGVAIKNALGVKISLDLLFMKRGQE